METTKILSLLNNYSNIRQVVKETILLDSLSLNDWADKYKVVIDSDADLSALRNYAALTSKNIQEVIKILNELKVTDRVISLSQESTLRSKQSAVIEDYRNRKKPLPNSTSLLTTVALSGTEHGLEENVISEILVETFEQILKGLYSVQKTIETMTFQVTTEVKMLNFNAN